MKSRNRDTTGELVGTSNLNPLFNIRIDNIIFPDSSKNEFSVNQLAEIMYENIDDNGNTYGMILEMIDHWKNNSAIKAEDSFITVN